MRADLLPKTPEGRIDHVVEECGEVLKAIGKLRRFGARATDQQTGITYDNIGKLGLELLDLRRAIDMVLCDLSGDET